MVFDDRYFYCYSLRLMYFCKAFGLRYIDKGINEETKDTYFKYEKCERLDMIIRLWNIMKEFFALEGKAVV